MNKSFKTLVTMVLVLTIAGFVPQASWAETGPHPADPGSVFGGAEGGIKWFDGVEFRYGKFGEKVGHAGIKFNPDGPGGAVRVWGGYVFPADWTPSFLGENVRFEASWHYARNEVDGSFGTPATTSLPVINGSNAIAPGFVDQLAFDTVSEFRSEEVYWGLEFLLQSDYSLLEDGSLVVSPFTGITFTDRRNDYWFDNHTVITNFHNMNLRENVDTDYVGWKFGARVTYEPIKRIRLFGSAALSVLGSTSTFNASQSYSDAGFGAFDATDKYSKGTVMAELGGGLEIDVWGYALVTVKAVAERWGDVPRVENPVDRNDKGAHLDTESITNFSLLFGANIPLPPIAQEEEEEEAVA